MECRRFTVFNYDFESNLLVIIENDEYFFNDYYFIDAGRAGFLYSSQVDVRLQSPGFVQGRV